MAQANSDLRRSPARSLPAIRKRRQPSDNDTSVATTAFVKAQNYAASAAVPTRDGDPAAEAAGRSAAQHAARIMFIRRSRWQLVGSASAGAQPYRGLR
jgi:hypothetical protein